MATEAGSARSTDRSTSAFHFSSRLLASAALDAATALATVGSAPTGLSSREAAERFASAGPNEIATQKPLPWYERLFRAARNPLVLLLLALAGISIATGDHRAASVIIFMVLLGVSLRYVQEARADAAAERLKAMVHVTATVIRDGAVREVPLREVVPGDVVHFAAGDMIPADVRLTAAKDLFVNQASLTGESMPTEKFEPPQRIDGRSPLELLNLCFLGTSVQSGTGTAVVIATGPDTYFGSMARTIVARQEETAFDRGIDHFTWLMIRFMAVMVPLVFVINGLTKHDWREAFFFALAVAVGLTPEMLPMIVSVCLSRGAVAMSRQQVIVKRLDAIQNFGAMDVLCTDKTGTLTRDEVILEHHCDVTGRESALVLRDALLVSHFQTGLRNVMDRAILSYGERERSVSLDGYRKVDEIPFDFTRKLMSVVVETPDHRYHLITKGAPEEVVARCTTYKIDDAVFPIEPAFVADLEEEYDALSADGFRVLAVASRECQAQTSYGRADERDLVLIGYVAFLDPPKESALPALTALRDNGIAVKVLTGDNELVTRKICTFVGLPAARIMLGTEIERLTDAELAVAVEDTVVFARVAPDHKRRIIHALKAKGHVVGFLGDGINDAPALRIADVGISVDTAVDVAKESADIILLEKSLMILEQGVREGRKVFSNIVKYIRMGASSNFGNMFSVLGASALLPFVPMAPLQILTNNLLYDFSQVPIPTDNVDPEQIRRPRPWDMSEIGRFILFIGPISSIFDYTTYAVMYFLFGARTPEHAALFQTGWFVESLMTQTLIIHVIRTAKLPFLQSRASTALMATTGIIMAVGVWLPYSPFAPALGFVHLPHLYWPILGATLVCYMALTQLVKSFLGRRGWI